MSDTDALEPCPFCGGKMMLREALWPSEGDTDAVIHAEPTECPIEGCFSIDTADQCVSVAAAWNRRALASLSGGIEVVAWRWRWDDMSEAERWCLSNDDPRPGSTPTRMARFAVVEPLVAASALSTAIRKRDEARASNANLFNIIADIRDASGLGAGPMLNELAAAIKALAEKARADAIEEAAKIAERDADWTLFQRQSKPDWRTGDESNIYAETPEETEPSAANVMAYRMGIATGRAIATAIRVLITKEPDHE